MRQFAAEQAAKLTFKSLRDIFRVLKTPSYPIFPDCFVFLCIPLIVIAYLIGGYYVILAPGNLYNAIVSEDWLLFRAEISNFALIATAVVVIKVFRGVLRESAANFMRLRLTRVLHHKYFGVSSRQPSYIAPPYYRLVTEETVDNPDQRIVADAREFSNSFFGIVAGGKGQGSDSGGLLEGVTSVLFYSQKTLLRTGWYGVFVAYLWSLIVALVTVFVVNRTSPAVFRQEKLEADFRYRHAELRRCAEEVAFLRGASFEERKLTECLNRAVSNTWVVVFRHMYLNFVQYGFGYYVSIVMYLAIALAIHQNLFVSGASNSFSSSMTAGEKARWIAQTGGIFIQLLYSFTMMIQLGTAASEFVSNSKRVVALLDAFTDMAGDAPVGRNDADTEPLIASEEGVAHSTLYCNISDGISVRELVIEPGNDSKIGPVSFSVAKGECVLLEGPTGSGKTSVLRVIRGLWRASSGTLQIPSDARAILFLPQVPYISPGLHTLRQLVQYPHNCVNSRSETDRIICALKTVGWRHINTAEKLDAKEDWSKRLSPGQAQLIAAARVLAANPAYVFLDEPTSSLDVHGEERVFRALKQAGITGLTVGHSRSLRPFHDKIISLKAN